MGIAATRHCGPAREPSCLRVAKPVFRGASDRMPTASPRTALRLLAAATVILALGCAALAVAWSEKRDEAACWRSAYEEDAAPPEGVC